MCFFCSADVLKISLNTTIKCQETDLGNHALVFFLIVTCTGQDIQKLKYKNVSMSQPISDKSLDFCV